MNLVPPCIYFDLIFFRQHLKDHHRLWQCERCTVCFQNKDEFKGHEQSESLCRAQASVEDHQLPDHERINKDQWKEIEVLLKAERGLTGIPKAKSESEKWFKTWEVLFAGAARPFNPCRWLCSLRCPTK